MVRIISPSYARAGKTAIQNYMGADVVYAVHTFEMDKYREAYPQNKIMEIPDSLRKNLCAVRNYIRDNAGDKYLVMMDDDTSYIGYFEKMVEHRLEKESLMDLITNGFQMAEDLGTVYWGFNVQGDPKFYRAKTPFSFISPILDPFTGNILPDDSLRYDERVMWQMDYDFWLQVLRKYHTTLRFNKYFYKVGHLDNPGGMCNYRTMDGQKISVERFRKKWGGKIVKLREHTLNPLIIPPLSGV